MGAGLTPLQHSQLRVAAIHPHPEIELSQRIAILQNYDKQQV